jgi:alpha-amylase
LDLIFFFLGIDWDSRAKEKRVFKITQGRRRGWNKHVSKELGNYDYLFGADV